MRRISIARAALLAMCLAVATQIATADEGGTKKLNLQIGFSSSPVGGYGYGYHAGWVIPQYTVSYTQKVAGGNGIYLAADYQISPKIRVGAMFRTQNNPIQSPVNAEGGMTTRIIGGTLKFAAGESENRRWVVGLTQHRKEYAVNTIMLDSNKQPKLQSLNVAYEPAMGGSIGYEIDGNLAASGAVKWFVYGGYMRVKSHSDTVLIDGEPTSQYNYMKDHDSSSLNLTAGLAF